MHLAWEDMGGRYGEGHQAALGALLQLRAGGLVQVGQLPPRQLGLEIEQSLHALRHQLIRGYRRTSRVVHTSGCKEITVHFRVSDPDSIRPLDPDPGGQKLPTKVEKI